MGATRLPHQREDAQRNYHSDEDNKGGTEGGMRVARRLRVEAKMRFAPCQYDIA